MQQERRVEFDVRVESPVRFAFAKQAQRGRFHASRKFVESLIAICRIEPIGGMGQDIRARIPHTVDSVSESHEALTSIELGAYDGFGALWTPDFKNHLERGSGRSTM